MNKRLAEAQKILRTYIHSCRKRFSVERYRLLEAILEQPGEFTFAQLLTYTRRHKKVFAASTVYRNFDIYIAAGLIEKTADTPVRYKVTLPTPPETGE